MLVTTETFDVAMVVSATQAAAGVAGPLNGVKMHLFTNNPALAKQMLLGAFTEPTYGSYAAQAVTFGAAKRDAQGNISTDTGQVIWQETGTPLATTVNGYFLTNTAGTTLLAAEYFPTPQNLVDLLSSFWVVAEWSANNAAAGQCQVGS